MAVTIERLAKPKFQGPYFIWTDYGLDGWSCREAATLKEAVSAREEQLSFGNSNVIITKFVKLTTQEAEE